MSDKKKYDLAIMNPPYDKGLHLKILEKVIPACNEVFNISPIRWLQDPLAKYKKNSDYIEYEHSIAEHIKEIIGLTIKDTQNLFGADTLFTSDLAIYCIDNKKHNFYSQFSTNKIIDKVFAQSKEFVEDNIETNASDGWRVRIPELRPLTGTSLNAPSFENAKLYLLHRELSYIFFNGKQKGKHWGQVKLSKGRKERTETEKLDRSIKFSSEEEAINFENSTKTVFYKYIYQSLKINQHSPKHLPFMSDYTKPWDNKRFCDYFNITGYIDDEHAEPNSEWEEILTTMEKYK